MIVLGNALEWVGTLEAICHQNGSIKMERKEVKSKNNFLIRLFDECK